MPEVRSSADGNESERDQLDENENRNSIGSGSWDKETRRLSQQSQFSPYHHHYSRAVNITGRGKPPSEVEEKRFRICVMRVTTWLFMFVSALYLMRYIYELEWTPHTSDPINVFSLEVAVSMLYLIFVFDICTGIAVIVSIARYMEAFHLRIFWPAVGLMCLNHLHASFIWIWVWTGEFPRMCARNTFYQGRRCPNVEIMVLDPSDGTLELADCKCDYGQCLPECKGLRVIQNYFWGTYWLYILRCICLIIYISPLRRVFCECKWCCCINLYSETGIRRLSRLSAVSPLLPFTTADYGHQNDQSLLNGVNLECLCERNNDSSRKDEVNADASAEKVSERKQLEPTVDEGPRESRKIFNSLLPKVSQGTGESQYVMRSRCNCNDPPELTKVDECQVKVSMQQQQEEAKDLTTKTTQQDCCRCQSSVTSGPRQMTSLNLNSTSKPVYVPRKVSQGTGENDGIQVSSSSLEPEPVSGKHPPKVATSQRGVDGERRCIRKLVELPPDEIRLSFLNQASTYWSILIRSSTVLGLCSLIQFILYFVVFGLSGPYRIIVALMPACNSIVSWFVSINIADLMVLLIIRSGKYLSKRFSMSLDSDVKFMVLATLIVILNFVSSMAFPVYATPQLMADARGTVLKNSTKCLEPRNTFNELGNAWDSLPPLRELCKKHILCIEQCRDFRTLHVWIYGGYLLCIVRLFVLITMWNTVSFLCMVKDLREDVVAYELRN